MGGMMKIKSERITRISSLLEREIYLYSRLHKIAKRIQDAMVKNDIDTLSGLVESEDSIFTQAEKLRQERLQVLLDIKTELNLSDDESSLGRMMEFMEEHDARDIQQLRDKLIESINKLDTLNRNNHALVSYSLDLNSRFMNLLVNLGQNNTLYHSSGKAKTPSNPKRRLVDRKV